MDDQVNHCTFNGCTTRHYAKDLCHGHWKQHSRGRALKPLRARRAGVYAPYTLSELLAWTSADGECLIWSRSGNQYGYGIAQHKGKQWMAHRLAYHLHTGEEIGAQVIHHTCSKPGCVNPEHLQLAHQADNNLEMLARKSYEARIAALEARVKELESLLDMERDVVMIR